MSSNMWRTLFTSNFDCEQYLYHYTSIDKAIKIIGSEELWFSSVENTNDSTESKLRIKFVQKNSGERITPDERTVAVTDYLKQRHNSIQILCFCQDAYLSQQELDDAIKLHTNHPKDKYFDISGRGFALPRMWAQYASNHEGVCFIVNRELFEKKLSPLAFLRKSVVSYKSFFTCHEIDEEQLQTLYEKTTMLSNGGLSFLQLLYTDNHFIDYNYFEKQKDWENEREYRYISMIDTSAPKSNVIIKDLFDFVQGIVIGEKIHPAYENAIRKTIENKCEVKKIHFDTNMCYVK